MFNEIYVLVNYYFKKMICVCRIGTTKRTFRRTT